MGAEIIQLAPFGRALSWVIGLGFSMLGGALGNSYSEASSQINKYGAIVDNDALKHAFAVEAFSNAISSMIGMPTATETGAIFAVVSSYLYNVLVSGVTFVIDSLKR